MAAERRGSATATATATASAPAAAAAHFLLSGDSTRWGMQGGFVGKPACKSWPTAGVKAMPATG